MKLRTISYSILASEYEATKAIPNSSSPSSRSQRFCIAQHHHAEILSVDPGTKTFKHEAPPWTAHHVINIPSFLYEDLMHCHSAWYTCVRLHHSIPTDVVETCRSTKPGKQLGPLLNGTKKRFIRLDQMSPKDFASLDLQRRRYQDLHDYARAKEQERDMVMPLVLNPWDETMDPGKEFRVFVPPPLCFDVAMQEHGGVQLVELYPFGAISECRACLFNCVLDGRVLYGLEVAQFIVTVEEKA
ncbi:hypothetical protein EJ02DRAFT_505929 [Clathrospora elynae]|uniref:Uncharacterized protein n=1 Tax=Clathrospora elynae TaxID=706981 RepID=A0A6A5SC73_9PLEO|nr:hypothetical protein EJ02DRAFT_505929 [Clathrospora elynae]